jgi:hypothetical protein
MAASRVTHRIKTIGINRVVVHGSFAPNGTSALVAANTHGKGFTVARTGVGAYRITFDNVYPELVSFVATPQVADATPTIVQFRDFTAATKILDILVLQESGGTLAAADQTADANARVSFVAIFRNSSVDY